jgi:hypothetical protein
MGFWDSSAEARRKEEAERRQRDDERARARRKEEALLEKQRKAEQKRIDEERRVEDEKAIAEMAKKFGGNNDGKDQKSAGGLSRGPGFGGAGSRYRMPQTNPGQEGPQIGYNPNAPREGHEPDSGGKGKAGKGDSSGTPRLPRPF